MLPQHDIKLKDSAIDLADLAVFVHCKIAEMSGDQ